MSYSITQYGKPLSKKKYSIDLEDRIFSSSEDDLVLDFTGFNKNNWQFSTGGNCTFKAGSYCMFNTGNNCTFEAGNRCVFKTGGGCTFKTGTECTFATDNNCTFDTYSDCTFKTGNGCTFDTGHGGTFDTLNRCTFKTAGGCTFNSLRDCTFDVYGAGCVFLITYINSCNFKQYDNVSIILDRNDNNKYILNKELIQLIKINK